MTRRSRFATEGRWLGRYLSGNRDYSPGVEEIRFVLTGCNHNSLVADRLRHQTLGEKSTVACFHFDFEAPKNQTKLVGWVP